MSPSVSLPPQLPEPYGREVAEYCRLENVEPCRVPRTSKSRRGRRLIAGALRKIGGFVSEIIRPQFARCMFPRKTTAKE